MATTAIDPATPAPPSRHLRPRGGAGTQRTTEVELFFDLVYVFAVTQLSHLVLHDLSIVGLAQAGFLLVVVWWAWIYTTWMTNWFDPASPAVRTILAAVMLASLLAAAALPTAFAGGALLFAASYVALQVGRNATAIAVLGRHRLRRVFARLLLWSLASAPLWLAGAVVAPDRRVLLWIPAFALDLAAPLAGYWLPGHGRVATTDYDIAAGHFTERCRLFVLIALGESIVVAGATAARTDLTAAAVGCLVLAFLETLALWWLYFGPTSERSHRAVMSSPNPGRPARDAYTYAHILIVAGIVLTAAADNLLIADPAATAAPVAAALFLAGPGLFLVGTTVFQWMTTGRLNRRHLLAVVLLLATAPIAGRVPLVALAAIVTSLLGASALREVGAATRTRLKEAPGVGPLPPARRRRALRDFVLWARSAAAR
jgi:low temperature requirement protein LtrA